MTVTTDQRARVAALLGREPRGLDAVALAAADGSPMVIRVASLVEDKPFPTLFWLVDPALCYRIDQEEAAGLIKRFQRRVDADPLLQGQMRADHRAHIALRDSYISSANRQRLEALGFGSVLSQRGIGGIADATRIRCLHTWYAAHLIAPNTVGGLLEQWWREREPGERGSSARDKPVPDQTAGRERAPDGPAHSGSSQSDCADEDAGQDSVDKAGAGP